MAENSNIEIREAQRKFDPQVMPITNEVLIPTEKQGESVRLRYVPRLNSKELLDYYQLTKDSIPEALDAAIANIVGITTDLTVSGNTRLTDNLYFISQLRRSSGEFGLSGQLTTLSQFTKHVSQLHPELEPRRLYKIVESIGKFQQTVLSEYKFKRCDPYSPAYSYLPENESGWVYLPSELGGGYITKPEMIELAKQYKEDKKLMELISSTENKPPTERKLTHDTTSSAMVGITETKTILSANALAKRGSKIISGEFADKLDSKDGLQNVHASMSGIGSGNAEEHYFDEHLVSLVIDEEMQTNHMIKQMKEQGITDDQIQRVIDRKLRRLPRFRPLTMSDLEGLSRDQVRKLAQKKKEELSKTDIIHSPSKYESFLGDNVPLQHVVALAAPDKYAGDYERRLKNDLNPRAIFLVREAAEMATNEFI